MELVYDLELQLVRRIRAAKAAIPGADFLVARATDDLSERLAAVQRRFALAADIGSRSPRVAETLLASGKVDSVLRVETAPELLGQPARDTRNRSLIAPLETLPLEPASLDLAVSVLSLQEMNDIPGMLVQIRRALRPDGLFLGVMAGQGTLAELRESLLAAETEITGGASPRVAPFADVRDAGGLLQRAGFALPVTDVDTVTVRYGDLFALLRDLRAMGVTNALAARLRRPTGRALFVRAAEIYAERFADADGRLRATFNLVWMSGWAPDASQQKPLKPGSAKMSLADALAATRGGGENP